MNSFFHGRTVAVTGGLGLIGSFLCEELLARQSRVILIDDESKGSWRYIPHLRSQVEYRRCDLTIPQEAFAALAGSELVFHLASRAYGVGFSQKNSLAMFHFNDQINTNVLSAIGYHRPRHALVVSSSCVYPDDGPTPMSDVEPLRGEPERVNLGYGWAKRILEQKADFYQLATGVPFTIVRPFNVYGERYNWCGDDSQAIPMLVKRVMDLDNPLVVWGSGAQRRNYIHALDCARCFLQLVERGGTQRVVNVGHEETISLGGLAGRLARLAGIDVTIVYDPTKPEGRLVKSSDSRLLRTTLGDDFRWTIGLDEGLQRMIGWYHDTFGARGSCRAAEAASARPTQPAMNGTPQTEVAGR